MIVSTEAMVMKSIKYGETSKIVTLFTRDFGKITLMAKGARGSQSKYGAALEPLSHSHVVFYKKETRDLHYLSQADLIEQYKSIIDDQIKLMAGFAILEYLNAVLHGEEEHGALFDTVIETFAGMNAAQGNPLNYLIRFLLDLSRALGFTVDFEHCLHCRYSFSEGTGAENEVRFETMSGGFYCGSCAPSHGGIEIPAEAFNTMRWIETAPREKLDASPLGKDEAQKMLRILHHHIASHIPEMRKIRTLSLLEAFL